MLYLKHVTNKASKAMHITHLDHLVLTVANIENTVEFYTSVMGLTEETFGEGRIALRFGNSKINLHQLGREFEPKAHHPMPGSADLCFITDNDLDLVIQQLLAHEVHIEEGPITRTGATGPILSVYFRDPDGNLIEVSQYLEH